MKLYLVDMVVRLSKGKFFLDKYNLKVVRCGYQKRKRGFKMTLHHYYSSSGRDLILEYIDSLPENEKTDGYSVMEHMENGEFDKILFKRWEKKVYEVYFQKHNRIFYITVDKDNIYLLHSCRKQKNKTEKTDAKIVKQRAKELGKLLGKTFI